MQIFICTGESAPLTSSLFKVNYICIDLIGIFLYLIYSFKVLFSQYFKTIAMITIIMIIIKANTNAELNCIYQILF